MILNHQKATSSPFIGIIMLDTDFPRIKGDIGNTDTFDFPVQFKVVNGASPERIVLKADKSLIQPFIEAGQWLIDQGAAALTTSCGFLALFHNQLQAAFKVPLFSSSLIQVHLARTIIQKEQKVGIITASKPSLTRDHLEAVGIADYPLSIVGLENTEEFASVFLGNKQTLDREKCRHEMHQAASDLIRCHPDVGAIVLECTNMPPYASAVREAAGGLPVFDAVTLLNYAYSTLTSTLHKNFIEKMKQY